MRNHGHRPALTAGLSVCGNEPVLIIDTDLQAPPELLPEMRALMDEGPTSPAGSGADGTVQAFSSAPPLRCSIA
jgi:hypothetical protein